MAIWLPKNNELFGKNKMIPKILIIGGTSGIGLALARAHENWQVYLVGSSMNKIQQLRINYPNWHIIQCDLCNEQQRANLLIQLGQIYDFKRIIYAAGWYLNERRFDLNAEQNATMLAINLQAFNDVFAWAVNHITQGGTLVCLSSVAGLIEYPYISLYAQCKRAMWYTALAYHTALLPKKINVLAVASGYVDTAKLRELNGGTAKHKPFLISENRAVAEIMFAINHNLSITIFPKRMKYLCALINRLPKWLVKKIMR